MRAAIAGAGESSAAARNSGSCRHMYMSPKNLPARAALGEVGGMRPGRGEVVLDRRAQALDPRRVERLAQADDAVAVVGGDVARRDQAFCRTWTARLATRSLFLAP